MNRLDVFMNIFIRWVGFGSMYGALAGGIAGTIFICGILVFGILGPFIGVVLGLISGIILGVILGLYTGLLTCSLFFPTINHKFYKRLIISTCTILGFAVSIISFSLLIYPHEYSGLAVLPSAIAALVSALVASRIVNWYTESLRTQLSV